MKKVFAVMGVRAFFRPTVCVLGILFLSSSANGQNRGSQKRGSQDRGFQDVGFGTIPDAADQRVYQAGDKYRATDDDNDPKILRGEVITNEQPGGVRDATVVLECQNGLPMRTQTNSNGGFLFMLYGLSSASCRLHAEAPQYSSEPLDLVIDPGMGTMQIGKIVLHPWSQKSRAEAFAVSVTLLAAPSGARKAFEQGQQQARHEKWDPACMYFRKAVELYPGYALAWLELGRAQVKQRNFIEAQESFRQATSQDPNLVAAYTELARVAASQKEWVLLADTTDHLIEQLSYLSPSYLFLNATAKYNLGKTGDAEHSAARGLQLDTKHGVPRLEYLYGLILMKQQNYSGAIEHIKTYLQLVPHASDAQRAQEVLSYLQQLASNGQPPHP